MPRRFTRYDLAGLVAVAGFGAAYAALVVTRAPDDVAPAERLLDPSTEIQLGEEWMGLYFKGDRVGLVHVEKSARDGGGYRYAMETRLRLVALGQDAPLDVRVGAELDPGLVLERFDFALDAGAASIAGKGTVRGTTVELAIETGGETVDRTLTLQHPPVLRQNLGPLLSRGGLEPGRRARYHVFDPMTQTDQPVDVEVIGPESIVVFDREVPATRIRTTAAGLTLDGWINDRGEMLRQELGLGLVAVRETREQARFGLLPAGRKGADLVAATMVQVPGLPADLAERETLRLRIGGVELAGFELTDHRQRLDGDVLTIRRETPGVGAPLPVADPPPGSLASDALIQSEHPKIRQTAAGVAGEARDTLTAARALARWVHDHLERRAVAGVPSALDTLQSRIGDCNEHATLFAALARSLGVPTRVVVGLVHVDGAFGYHAWNEILTADGWLSVDATWGQLPADVGHVAFLRGGLSEQVRLLPVIGRLVLSAVD